MYGVEQNGKPLFQRISSEVITLLEIRRQKVHYEDIREYRIPLLPAAYLVIPVSKLYSHT